MRRLPILLLAVLPLASFANASVGQLFEAGGLVDITREGREVAGRSGLPLQVGDHLEVERRGAAALRMADDEVISLGESTRFKVLDYRFDPASPSGNQARYRLESGSARLISGLIAKRQPGAVVLEIDSGEVKTLGTDYSAGVCGAGCNAAPGVYLGVNAGAIAVSNAAGSITAAAGQVVLVPAGGGAPFIVASMPAAIALAPDPASLTLIAETPAGSLRIEATNSVCDTAASPSQPDCTASR